VLADEQTAGRGRKSRRWEMTPGKGLAMSLILRPTSAEEAHISRFTALAALGLVHALRGYGLVGKIKWPNDVLLRGKKVAGVLVETAWVGDAIETCVIGMGVNVDLGSVPESADLRMPATSVEAAAGVPVNRWTLLADILQAMMALRPIITGDAFIEAWNQHLALRDAWVNFHFSRGVVEKVKLQGIDGDGKLTLQHKDGREETVNSGEILVANIKF
jgi:BirA family biotin operon repressor/biotin-[acetyl-CoA-carboxylase] ligase